MFPPTTNTNHSTGNSAREVERERERERKETLIKPSRIAPKAVANSEVESGVTGEYTTKKDNDRNKDGDGGVEGRFSFRLLCRILENGSVLDTLSPHLLLSPLVCSQF
jgi:hypothetical protein